MVAILIAEVRELKARLAQNSSNSSRPPSSDLPGAAPKPPEKPEGSETKRKRGGQPGHPKHDRALLPPERITKSIPLKPTACKECQGPLFGNDSDPHCHQVLDIPRIIAMATEYQLHALYCPQCRVFTQADLPAGVPSGNFGPRLQAVMGLLSGRYHLSKRQIEELLGDVFDAHLSLGSVSNLEQQTSEALAEPFAEALEHTQTQPVRHADETGWREDKKRAWLWVVVAGYVAVFLVRQSRGAKVAKELLGRSFRGILVSDRWNGYNWIQTSMRQLCWAHLYRHFKGFEDHGPEPKRLGLALQAAHDRMFHEWHRVRDGTLSRAQFQKLLRPIRREIIDLLEQGRLGDVAKVSGRCREILLLRDALFTFARVHGVEPTNNAAEQAVRPAVLWRKNSFGTDSERGSRFVERILTTVTTLRLQKRNVLDYLTAACEARLYGHEAPSLLPEATRYQELAMAA